MQDVYLSLGNVPCSYQAETLLKIIQPILAKRFKEKLDALELDEKFLEKCKVSQPIQKDFIRQDGVGFNTIIEFTFDRKHPVLKKSFSVAYQRARFEEYFGEVDTEEVFFEDIPSAKEGYLNFWSDYFGKLLGPHFIKHGGVTIYELTGPIRFNREHGIDSIICLPSRGSLNKALHDSLGEEKPFEIIQFKLVIRDSYALLDVDIPFDVKVTRRDYDGTNKYRYLRDKGDTRFSHL